MADRVNPEAERLRKVLVETMEPSFTEMFDAALREQTRITVERMKDMRHDFQTLPHGQFPARPAPLDIERAVNEAIGVLIARYASDAHMAGEVDDCDGSDAVWCNACWKVALDFGDPDTTAPSWQEADAEYTRLASLDPAPPPEPQP